MVRFWTDMCDKFAARLALVAALLLKAEETIIETLRGLSTQQAESVKRRQAFGCVIRICSARATAVPSIRVLQKCRAHRLTPSSTNTSST